MFEDGGVAFSIRAHRRGETEEDEVGRGVEVLKLEAGGDTSFGADIVNENRNLWILEEAGRPPHKAIPNDANRECCCHACITISCQEKKIEIINKSSFGKKRRMIKNKGKIMSHQHSLKDRARHVLLSMARHQETSVSQFLMRHPELLTLPSNVSVSRDEMVRSMYELVRRQAAATTIRGMSQVISWRLREASRNGETPTETGLLYDIYWHSFLKMIGM